MGGSQTLAQESTNTYMDFLNSMFFYYRGSMKKAERSTGEAETRNAEEPERSTGEAFRDLIREAISRSREEAWAFAAVA